MSLILGGVVLLTVVLVLAWLQWSAFLRTALPVTGVGIGLALVVVGCVVSSLRTRFPMVLVYGLVAGAATMAGLALVLLVSISLLVGGFERPEGEWAVSPDGRYAAVPVAGPDDSGDPVWNVAVLRSGAIWRVGVTYGWVRLGAERQPEVSFTDDGQLVIDNRIHPVECRPAPELQRVADEVRRIVPRRAATIRVTVPSLCGEWVQVRARLAADSNAAACQAVRRTATALGWVFLRRGGCGEVLSPGGVAVQIWPTGRGARLYLDEVAPRATD